MSLDQLQKLFDLIRLRLSMHVLQVRQLRDPRMRENVMTALYPDEPEPERLRQRDHILKADIFRAVQNFLKKLTLFHGRSVSRDLLVDERLDELHDLVPLVTRQAVHLLKNLPDFSGWTALAGGLFLDAQEMFNRDVENLHKSANLLRAQRDQVAFPGGITGLLQAHLLGDFRLRQPQSLPRLKEPLAERGPRP
jgi:hypothetical protein